MKAAELRIGNWVDIESIDVQVECLPIDYDYSVLEPIPLTEEWLIKFGFDGQDYNLFTIELSRNQFMILKDEWLIVISNNCKYVHQLQNLYFALTGEELTIK